MDSRHLRSYELEKVVENPVRGVKIRRDVVSPQIFQAESLDKVPFQNYDYSKVSSNVLYKFVRIRLNFEQKCF